jgi:hypothetical protein
MSTTTTKNNEKEEQVVIIYRAHTLGRKYRSKTYDNELVYSYADLYELHATKYPLRSENYRYYRQSHPNDPVIVNAYDSYYDLNNDRRRIIKLQEPTSFSERAISIGAAPSHMIVPTKLVKRRFKDTLQFDVDSYKDDNFRPEDPNVVFLEFPIPGIAPIREILTVTGEESLMHEVIAQSEEPESSKSDYDRQNYSISYEPVRCFSKLDCPLHFAPVQELNPPEIVILGLAKEDPEVIAANKKFAARRKRVKTLKIIQRYMKALQIMDLNMLIMDNMKAISSGNMDYVSAKLSEMKEVLDSFASRSSASAKRENSQKNKNLE